MFVIKSTPIDWGELKKNSTLMDHLKVIDATPKLKKGFDKQKFDLFCSKLRVLEIYFDVDRINVNFPLTNDEVEKARPLIDLI